MQEIVILSDRPQTELVARLSPSLDRAGLSFPVRLVSSSDTAVVDGGVLIIKDIKNRPVRLCAGHGTVAVADSDSVGALRTAGRLRLPTVVCGMACGDTLIAESVTPGRYLLCLQRTVPTVFGGTVQPCVTAVRTAAPIGLRELLLTVGALFACGQQKDEFII